jgi:hypothetical protein
MMGLLIVGKGLLCRQEAESLLDGNPFPGVLVLWRETGRMSAECRLALRINLQAIIVEKNSFIIILKFNY